ncbi:unnamed protein product [Lupinus luteus]|uniref:RING-type E3 ubiquitin transferase n=1 Tax=Lupinus luteus TaxID=3873 RepID=A0AAV1XYB2_LUPLU
MLNKKCAHIEYSRLKEVLKSCRRCKQLHTSSDSDINEHHLCRCQSCSLRDEKFFSELKKEASDIVGYFNSRVRHILHLHTATGMKGYVWRLRQCFKNNRQALEQEGKILIEYIAINAIAMRKILKKYDKVRNPVNGENFKSRMLAEHIELLHSPWLIELGAFYLNLSGLDGCDLDVICGHFSCDLNMAEAVMTLRLPDSIKLEYNLNCAICLDFVFNPYALGCGHIFCKSCACSAASVMIFEGLKSASSESKCPICREVGVYSKPMHMLELDLLIKKRCKNYWKERLYEERCDTLHQSKVYWNIRYTYSSGLM